MTAMEWFDQIDLFAPEALPPTYYKLRCVKCDRWTNETGTLDTKTLCSTCLKNVLRNIGIDDVIDIQKRIDETLRKQELAGVMREAKSVKKKARAA